jgi:ATP-dependent Clp protease protease subunit
MIGNIYITGQIGDFDKKTGVKLVDVISQVKNQPLATSYSVYINSEGGVVNDGMQIYDYLESLKAAGKAVKTIAVGQCDSIATVIFMAGDTRVFSGTPEFMIHVPWGGVQGNSEDMKEYLSTLEKEEKKMIDFYMNILNIEQSAIEPLLRNETFLTPEQAKALGFITEEPVQVLAKAILKPNDDMNTLSEKDMNFFESLFTKILGKGKKDPIVSKMVQDATGAELNFTDLADDATIEAGASATIDGNPASGEYTMPDGTVYVFAAGVLSEIKEPEGDDELASANARIAELEAELQASKTETETVTTELTAVRKDVKELKTQIFSKFKVDDKKIVARKKDDDPDDRTSSLKEYLTEKRKR